MGLFDITEPLVYKGEIIFCTTAANTHVVSSEKHIDIVLIIYDGRECLIPNGISKIPI
jgi:hypothetical protein